LNWRAVVQISGAFAKMHKLPANNSNRYVPQGIYEIHSSLHILPGWAAKTPKVQNPGFAAHPGNMCKDE